MVGGGAVVDCVSSASSPRNWNQNQSLVTPATSEPLSSATKDWKRAGVSVHRLSAAGTPPTHIWTVDGHTPAPSNKTGCCCSCGVQRLARVSFFFSVGLAPSTGKGLTDESLKRRFRRRWCVCGNVRDRKHRPAKKKKKQTSRPFFTSPPAHHPPTHTDTHSSFFPPSQWSSDFVPCVPLSSRHRRTGEMHSCASSGRVISDAACVCDGPHSSV